MWTEERKKKKSIRQGLKELFLSSSVSLQLQTSPPLPLLLLASVSESGSIKYFITCVCKGIVRLPCLLAFSRSPGLKSDGVNPIRLIDLGVVSVPVVEVTHRGNMEPQASCTHLIKLEIRLQCVRQKRRGSGVIVRILECFPFRCFVPEKISFLMRRLKQIKKKKKTPNKTEMQFKNKKN